jgi:predicted DNA-binding transcriptional regulator YafY
MAATVGPIEDRSCPCSCDTGDVVETTARLLEVLSRLQAGAGMSGPELAARLGVTTRTVRRDVDRLRQLGYAIHSDTGVRGGYRLASGGRAMPPLLLDEDEAVALAVCVRAAAGDSVAGIASAAVTALGKLERTVPAAARTRIGALVASTVRVPTTGDEVDPDVLMTVSSACRDGVRVTAGYCDARGRSSERRLEPYRIVSVGRRWYLVAFDLDRRGWRSLRLDRLRTVVSTGHGVGFTDPPEASAFVRAAITTSPYRYRAVAVVHAPLDRVAQRVPATVATLEDRGDGTTLLTTGADDLDVLSMHLGALGLAFTVVEPDELRVRLTEVAARLTAAASAPPAT